MISSNPSTACSSPNNNSVEKVIKNDQVRYRQKGYGLYVSTLITLCYFTVIPKLLHTIYPMLGLTEENPYIFIFMIWCLHVGFNFSAYVLSYFVYTAKNPFIERYRILNKPWPWESDPKEWKEMVSSAVKFFIVNQCIITPILIIAEYHLNGIFFSISQTEFPSLIEIVLQCSFCMIVDDFFFYWGHRLLHHPKLYPHIHKIHHRWHHTVLISNEYSHPFEYVIANLPAAVGPKILGKNMHVTTLWMWIIMRVGESLDAHCGYEFSWSPYRLIPLSGSSTSHDFHHSQNVGNYGSYFTFWDTICQTNKPYFAWLAKREKEAALGQIREEFVKMKTKMSNDPAAKLALIKDLAAEPVDSAEIKKCQ